ncbi:MAG: HEPN domain-containing protein [Deltaproteobacteria bacterium]|nr:HEPN domain-containing protein [Deltaproteobacteria bacterium]
MNMITLAESYLDKASKRLRVLEVLLEQDGFSDVVREAQELVELALKGMLRYVGIDPPKWHDVGPILTEHQELLPRDIRPSVARLAKISKRLRREREFAFYGDIDFIPTEEYTREDALQAMDDARFVLEKAALLIKGWKAGKLGG